MLRIAREETARAGLTIQFREGSSRELGPGLGMFRLVVIGRAFHWMDREETLRRLDQIIETGGAVTLFGDDHPKVPDNRWTVVFDQIIDRYSEADTARTTRQMPGWLSHEAVLLKSPFPHLERIGVIEPRVTPIDHLVDRALSLSSVSHVQIGTRADLARELREAMAPLAVNGLVTEVVETEALSAWREALQ
jgi:hypothetical protein